ncbi:hypothetical protein [Nonomuraea sp. CA-141351]|uniref:hypothetical protein n=1 Tax=Nonomuraea sp. CA-141351 TaxID=3239996 RepID=UPI003D8C5E71
MNDTFASVSHAVPPVLEDQLAEWSLRAGITVEVWAMPEQPLPALVTDVVHGVIFDVLGEVERQGRARTVSVALTVSAGGLRLTVSDDGRGTSAEAYEVRLKGRQAELQAMGGGLTVNGVRGEGTTVSAALPRLALA